MFRNSFLKPKHTCSGGYDQTIKKIFTYFLVLFSTTIFLKETRAQQWDVQYLISILILVFFEAK